MTDTIASEANGAGDSGTRIAARIALAKQHHQSGQLEVAKRLYDDVLSADPGNADALHLSGVLALQHGRHDDAHALISRALERRPDFIQARNNLGIVLKAQGRFGAAADAFAGVIESDPASADAHFNLATALQAGGRVDDAEQAYRRANELDPRSPDAATNLAALLVGGERAEEAFEILTGVTAGSPGFAPGHYNLASALTVLGRLDEAVIAYRRAIELQPDFARAYLQLAEALGTLGRLEEGLSCYRRGVELDPSPASDLGPTGPDRDDPERIRRFHVIADEWSLPGFDPRHRHLLPINPLLEAAGGKAVQTLAFEDVCFKETIVSMARFAECDTSYPGIALLGAPNPGGKKYRLIDGNHRIHRLRYEGLDEGPFHVFVLSEVEALIKPFEHFNSVV